MPGTETQTVSKARSGRERILDAAYELFSRSGVRAIGVDTITAQADVAKMTLYRNFASKNDLVLDRRLVAGAGRAPRSLAGRSAAVDLRCLLRVGAREDFEGCAFVTSLLEFDDATDPVRRACIVHLAAIRSFVSELASAAGVPDPQRVAGQWHLLMKGSIIAAHEGDRDAAMKARELGELLLARHDIAVPA